MAVEGELVTYIPTESVDNGADKVSVLPLTEDTSTPLTPVILFDEIELPFVPMGEIVEALEILSVP